MEGKKKSSKSSKNPKRGNSARNREEASTTTRAKSGKAYKRIISQEESSSDGPVNASFTSSDDESSLDSGSSSLGVSESGRSSPFPLWRQNTFKPIQSSGPSAAEKGGEKDAATNVNEAARGLDDKMVTKHWENCKAMAITKLRIEQMIAARRSNKNEVENVAKNEPTGTGSVEKMADLKFPPVTGANKGNLKRQSDPGNSTTSRSTESGHSTGDNTCKQGGAANLAETDRGLNKKMASKDWEKCKAKSVGQQIEQKKAVKRSKEAENVAENEPTGMGSTEKIANLKISPVSGENKGNRKRRSDPSDALKENRQ